MKSKANVLSLLLAAVLAAGFLTACRFPPDATPSQSPTAEATPTSEPTDAPTATSGPSPSPSPTPALEERLGYIKDGDVSLSGEAAVIRIDYVEIFGGTTALTKGAEDGIEVDGEYYIRDRNPALRTFTLAPDCEILLLDPLGGAEPTLASDPAGLAARVAEALHAKGALFEIDVSGTTVYRIHEFFVP